MGEDEGGEPGTSLRPEGKPGGGEIPEGFLEASLPPPGAGRGLAPGRGTAAGAAEPAGACGVRPKELSRLLCPRPLSQSPARPNPSPVRPGGNLMSHPPAPADGAATPRAAGIPDGVSVRSRRPWMGTHGEPRRPQAWAGGEAAEWQSLSPAGLAPSLTGRHGAPPAPSCGERPSPGAPAAPLVCAGGRGFGLGLGPLTKRNWVGGC